MIMAFTREQQLLLWCLGNDGYLPTLSVTGLDWHAFLDLAKTHNVIPIVSNKFRNFSHGKIPKEISSALQAWRLESTRHNMALIMSLSNIIDLFKAGDITAVPFKGPATAMMAYGDLSLRTCGDLDLF